MNIWQTFLTDLFNDKATPAHFTNPIHQVLSECNQLFPGFRISFWSISTRKNQILIHKIKDHKLETTQRALSQFKFEKIVRSKESPYYYFSTKTSNRILIPLFVSGQLSGCVSVAAAKSKTSKQWKARLPYFFIAAKRLLKWLELSIKDHAIETLIELNQNLETQMIQKEFSLEQEKRAHLQASKMATLGEVAAGIAHEINNPLTIIMSRVAKVEMILQKNSLMTTDFSDSIGKINQTIERIAKIINGLRRFAHAGGDKKQNVTLIKVINDSLELCQERLKKNEIELRVIKSDFDVEVSAHDTQLIQVLLNLIINSLDAIKGLSEKWIEIEYKIEKDHLNLIVRDSGAGLSPDVAKKIMNPFYTTKDREQGTGLGLSLSKTIIENHEGKLFYNSNAKHTEFVIELPYMRTL